MDGSKLILTPNVETGLLAQRAENTVMQALESLNDSQVNDFLSGKSPLNLSVRLGDHMMLIQLQLSTLNSSSQNGNRSKTHKSRTITASAGNATPGTSSNVIQASSSSSSSRSHSSRTTLPISFRRVMASDSIIPVAQPIVDHVREAHTLTKQEIDSIHSIVKNLTESENATIATIAPASDNSMDSDSAPRNSISESPIKSLSNLVSSSINTIPPACNNNSLPSCPASPCADPISANLTSCLCRSLDNNDNNSCEPNCLTRIPEPQQPSTSATTLHRTAYNPIARHKTKVQTLRKHTSFNGSTLPKPEQEVAQPAASQSAPNSPQRLNHPQLPHSRGHHYQQQHHLLQQSQSQLNPQPGTSSTQSRVPTTDPNSTENPALAEASRNLTQTLRKLSKRVFTNKTNDASSQDAAARNANSGAVIESMKHHGKGIYSGTFSGTLNPALQDKFGRPKRDISTIIHILNDLLSAAPQCARSGTKIYFEPSQTTAAAAAVAAATAGATSGVNVTNPTSAASSSSRGSNNFQTTVAMTPSTPSTNSSSSSSSSRNSFTTPVVAPSPRLVTRCVPTPIQTKKFPSNGTTITISGPSSADCILCKSLVASIPSTSSATYGRCQHHQKVAVPKVLCKCGLPLTPTAGPSSSGSSNIYHCQRCAAISAAELENSKTKSKLDNLRLIMQQKKERREARKQKCAPYSMTPPSTLAFPPSAQQLLAGGSGSTLEPVRTAHLTQLTVPTTNTTANGIEMMDVAATAAAAAAAAAVVESESTAAAANETTDITASSQETTDSTHTSINSSNNNAATATATATTTTTSATAAAAAAAATTSAATSSEAAQNTHQLVEEVDTVA
ncbi:midnolin homolog isoform X2 [Topomyia yanbarensis]|nr:midnolin homolog isoform X2 [Topomyia yanbarensis]